MQKKPLMTCYRVECDMICPPNGSRTDCHHLQPVYAAIIEASNLAALVLEAHYTGQTPAPSAETIEPEQHILILERSHYLVEMPAMDQPGK